MNVKRIPQVSVSVLNMDFTRLGASIKDVEEAGAGSLHMDIMDGNFVNNISFGHDVVKSVRGITDLPIHTHLMIRHPEKFIERFFDAGSDTVTMHLETLSVSSLAFLEDRRVGLSLNPDVPLSLLEAHLGKVSRVLIMSVFAGFGGQKFIPQSLERISRLSRLRSSSGFDFIISVDGGIGPQSAADCRRAGADEVVVGTYVSRADDPAAAIDKLNTALQI